ncbi:hypothetical protein ACLB1E_27755 [Escherichia coli]
MDQSEERKIIRSFTPGGRTTPAGNRHHHGALAHIQCRRAAGGNDAIPRPQAKTQALTPRSEIRNLTKSVRWSTCGG